MRKLREFDCGAYRTFSDFGRMVVREKTLRRLLAPFDELVPSIWKYLQPATVCQAIFT